MLTEIPRRAAADMSTDPPADRAFSTRPVALRDAIRGELTGLKATDADMQICRRLRRAPTR